MTCDDDVASRRHHGAVHPSPVRGFVVVVVFLLLGTCACVFARSSAQFAVVSFVAVELSPSCVHAFAVERGLVQSHVHHVVHFAHPTCELVSRFDDRWMFADELLEVLRTFATRIDPGEHVDERLGVFLLLFGGMFGELRRQRVQEDPRAPSQHLSIHASTLQRRQRVLLRRIFRRVLVGRLLAVSSVSTRRAVPFRSLLSIPKHVGRSVEGTLHESLQRTSHVRSFFSLHRRTTHLQDTSFVDEVCCSAITMVHSGSLQWEKILPSQVGWESLGRTQRGHNRTGRAKGSMMGMGLHHYLPIDILQWSVGRDG